MDNLTWFSFGIFHIEDDNIQDCGEDDTEDGTDSEEEEEYHDADDEVH